MTTDYSTLKNEIEKLKKRLEEVQLFIDDRSSKLESNKEQMVKLLKKAGITVTGFGNCYSTGINESGDFRTFRDEASLVVHVKCEPLGKPYKAGDKTTTKVKKIFEDNFKDITVDSNCGFHLHDLKDGSKRANSEFKIWIH